MGAGFATRKRRPGAAALQDAPRGAGAANGDKRRDARSVWSAETCLRFSTRRAAIIPTLHRRHAIRRPRGFRNGSKKARMLVRGFQDDCPDAGRVVPSFGVGFRVARRVVPCFRDERPVARWVPRCFGDGRNCRRKCPAHLPAGMARYPREVSCFLNIQSSTSNAERPTWHSRRRWTLAVGCWLFDVPDSPSLRRTFWVPHSFHWNKTALTPALSPRRGRPADAPRWFGARLWLHRFPSPVRPKPPGYPRLPHRPSAAYIPPSPWGRGPGCGRSIPLTANIASNHSTDNSGIPLLARGPFSAGRHGSMIWVI